MKFLLIISIHALSFILGGCVTQDYVATLDSIDPMDGLLETLVNFENVDVITVIGRNKRLNGTFVFSENMNNEQFQTSLQLYRSSTGGAYTIIPYFIAMTPICDFFKKYYVPLVEPSLHYNENTNFPVVGPNGLCPIPAGTYYLKEVDLGTQNWPSHLPRNFVKAVVTFFKNNISVGGFNIVFKIEDKV